MSTWVNYKAIKERIRMEHVLEHYGVLETLHLPCARQLLTQPADTDV
jgi:hypothetical protein